MIRNSGLHQKKRYEETSDPMEGVANLVDVMIVFACGLMVSIVLNWNVNLNSGSLNNVTTVIDESQLEEIEDAEILSQDGQVSGNYESMGVVVQDPKTGKLYVIKGAE